MVQFANGGFYPDAEPPAFEWLENDLRLWYEERPHMILHYYKSQHPHLPNSRLSVFVNMAFRPTTEEITAFIVRGLEAGGVTFKRVYNLRLNNWSGENNAFWYADLEETNG